MLFRCVNHRESLLCVEAEHLIDPTMLLSAEDYLRLVCEDNIEPGAPSVVSYILDKSQEKERITDAVAAQMGIPVRPLSVSFNHTDPVFRQKYVGTYIPVTEWLRSFSDAQFVITDSFHGAVFSIIFNKPFFVIGNKVRGMARFSSLLEMFGLEDRLVEPGTEITPEMITRPLDYDRVNTILEQECKKAAEFLKNAIEP